MGASENLEAAKAGYAAFAAGDAEAAMENISDDCEWVVQGDSSVSGTKRGKQEIGEFWAQIGGKEFSTEPQHWFADGDMVAVFVHTKLAGQESDSADLLTYDDDGKLVKFQSAGGEQIQKEVFG